MKIDVHVHFPDSNKGGADAVISLLTQILHRSNQIMASVDQINAEVAVIGGNVISLTDAIAAEGVQVTAAIQALKDQIGAGTVTGIDPAALDGALANLQNIAAATAAAKAAVESIFTPDAPATPA